VSLQKTVIIICGPTAVGKTALAIQIAKHFNTKIISADSRQCFKELNIGVAKPSIKELQTVEHFFINSHSIQQNVHAALFEQYALEKVQEIFTNQSVAVMVGGTGLYIKAFCEGLDDVPAIPDEIRENIIANYQANGLAWLQTQVKNIDEDFWQIAEQQNPQRLMRALEVKSFTGKSITSFRKGNVTKRNFHCIKIGLNLPREALYLNINNRVDTMMQEGLLDEVKQLLAYQHFNALQTVGYKELFSFLQQQCSLQEAVENIKKNTRHYAKRQLTWFKKDAAIQWYQPNDVTNILAAINSSFL
jgi:tRNA dimethylallyltransferase